MFKMVEVADINLKVYFLLIFLPIALYAELLVTVESTEGKLPVLQGCDTNPRPLPLTAVVSRQTRSTRRLKHVSRPQPRSIKLTNRPNYIRHRTERRRNFQNHPKNDTRARRPLRQGMRRPRPGQRKNEGLQGMQRRRQGQRKNEGHQGMPRHRQGQWKNEGLQGMQRSRQGQRKIEGLQGMQRRRQGQRKIEGLQGMPRRRQGQRKIEGLQGMQRRRQGQRKNEGRQGMRRRLQGQSKNEGRQGMPARHRQGQRKNEGRQEMPRRRLRRRMNKGHRKPQSVHHLRTDKPLQTEIRRHRGSPIKRPIVRFPTNRLTKTRHTSTGNPTNKQSSSKVGTGQPKPKAVQDIKKPKKGTFFPPMFRGILRTLHRLKGIHQKYMKMNITRFTTAKPSVVRPKQPKFVAKLRQAPKNRKHPDHTDLKKPGIMRVFSTKKPYSGKRRRILKRPTMSSRSRGISRVNKPWKDIPIPTRTTPIKQNCRKPPHILHGHIQAPPSYSHGSKIIYSCKKGYKLVGIATHLCKSDGKWSGKLPSCIDDDKPGNKTDLKRQLTKISKDINDIEETSDGKAFIAGIVALVILLLFLTCHCIRVSATRRRLSDKHQEVVDEGLVPERDVPGVFEVSNGLCKKLCCCDSGLPTSFRPRKSRSRTSTSSLRNREANHINSLSRTSVRRSKHGSIHKVDGISSRTSVRSKPSYDRIKENRINSSSRLQVRPSNVAALHKVGDVSSKTSTSSKPSYDRIQENGRYIDEEEILADYYQDPGESIEAVPRYYEESILPQNKDRRTSRSLKEADMPIYYEEEDLLQDADRRISHNHNDTDMPRYHDEEKLSRNLERRISHSQKGTDMPRFYEEEGLPKYANRRISRGQNNEDMPGYYDEETLIKDIDRKILKGQKENDLKEPAEGIEAMQGYCEEDSLPEYTDRQMMYQSQGDSDINDNSYTHYYNDNATLSRKLKHNQRKPTINEWETLPYFYDRKKVESVQTGKTRRKRRSGIRLSPHSRLCKSEFDSGTKVVLQDIRQEKKVKKQRPSRCMYRNRNTNTNIDSSEEQPRVPLYSARQSLLTYKDHQEYMQCYDYLNMDNLHDDNKTLTKTSYSYPSPTQHSDRNGDKITEQIKYLDELDLLHGSEFDEHVELSKVFHDKQTQDIGVKYFDCINDSDIQDGFTHGFLKTEINLDSGNELQDSSEAANRKMHPNTNEKDREIGFSDKHYEEKMSIEHDKEKNQEKAGDRSDLINEQESDTFNIKPKKYTQNGDDVILSEGNRETLMNSLISDQNVNALQSEGKVQDSNIEADGIDVDVDEI